MAHSFHRLPSVNRTPPTGQACVKIARVTGHAQVEILREVERLRVARRRRRRHLARFGAVSGLGGLVLGRVVGGGGGLAVAEREEAPPDRAVLQRHEQITVAWAGPRCFGVRGGGGRRWC